MLGRGQLDADRRGIASPSGAFHLQFQSRHITVSFDLSAKFKGGTGKIDGGALQQIPDTKGRNGSRVSVLPCRRQVRYAPKSVARNGHGGCDGQSRPSALRPTRSDVDLLGYRQSIVDIDAQIAHRALNLRVAKKQLNCP